MHRGRGGSKPGRRSKPRDCDTRSGYTNPDQPAVHLATQSSEDTMKVIYADFNDFAADGTLPLTCKGSVTSIASLKEGLKDGEEVWFTDGELRVKGHVFRCKDGSWEGRSD